MAEYRAAGFYDKTLTVLGDLINKQLMVNSRSEILLSRLSKISDRQNDILFVCFIVLEGTFDMY